MGTNSPEDSPADEVDELLELVTVLAYGGCAWWVAVAGASLYWAAGGTTGVGTLWGGDRVLSGAREQWIVSLLWIAGAVKLVPAVLALTLARRWRGYGLSRVVQASAWLLGLTLVPYVAVEAAVRGLVRFSALDPAQVEPTAIAWGLLFWNPWWVIGVVLFCAAAWLDRYAHGLSTSEGAAGP